MWVWLGWLDGDGDVGGGLGGGFNVDFFEPGEAIAHFGLVGSWGKVLWAGGGIDSRGDLSIFGWWGGDKEGGGGGRSALLRGRKAGVEGDSIPNVAA